MRFSLSFPSHFRPSIRLRRLLYSLIRKLIVKEKYGSDIEAAEGDEDEDSEDAESEDEDGEELTPAMDAAILRTLARIRRKDPAIYEVSKDVFEGESCSCYRPCLRVKLSVPEGRRGTAKTRRRESSDSREGQRQGVFLAVSSLIISQCDTYFACSPSH